MKFNFLFTGLMVLFSQMLVGKNFSDFSYTTGGDGFKRYSLTYQLNISTANSYGVNYSLYNGDDYPDISSIRLIYNHYFKNNLFFSLKPFYYFEKNGTSSAGAKSGIGLVKGKDEVYSTYSLFFSYQNQKINSTHYSDMFAEVSAEKDYYNQFFLFLKAALNLSYDVHKNGYSDDIDLINYNYNGPLTSTLYSDLGIRFGRSFKPDFNSYLYVGFDRLNTRLSDLNSYSIGFETFLDENDNYSMDISYNYADFKKIDNENFWKFRLGVNF